MLTITHTHADGTTLDGSRKGDGVWEICKANGWRFSRHAGIYLRNSRDADARRHVIDPTAEALRAKGHDVAENIDNTPRPTAEREADRAERADDRADRYAERAGKAAGRSSAALDGVHRVGDRIPFGQPILVGHHSEGKARRDVARMDAGMRRSIAEGERAAELARRSRSAAGHMDHRNHPRVIMRRIERLETDARHWARVDADDTASGGYRDRAEREAAKLAEEIAHWRDELDKLRAADVFVPWGPEHFQPGDWANIGGRWCEVARVNTKSVSVRALWETREDTQRAPWDKVHGRRRDAEQMDRPNGEPWPVDLARKVARWGKLVHSAGLPCNEYSDERRNAKWAQRIAHRLDLGAAQSEVTAHEPDAGDIDARRMLAAAYLNVFDRLTTGERVADILADLPDMPQVEPEWQMPEGDPQRVPVRDVKPGDIIAGLYESGMAGGREMLLRGFAGPVESVTPHEGDDYSGERFVGWWYVTLTTGERGQYKPWQALAVHVAEQPNSAEVEPASVPEPSEPVADVQPEPTAADRWQALVGANITARNNRDTKARTRRMGIARRRVHGVPDDYVGADFDQQHPGTYEEKSTAYLAAYAALLAADGAERTHPAEPEPTPDVAPPPAVVPVAPVNPWDDLLAAHLHTTRAA